MKKTNQSAAVKADRYKVGRGEPGQNIVTPLRDGDPVIENPPVTLASPSSSSLPAVIPEKIESVALRLNDEIANWRVSFILAYKEYVSQTSGLKGRIISQFLKGFNSGALLPNIYKKLGSISSPTLYRLKKNFDERGIDGVTPRYGGVGRSMVAECEKAFLEGFLLNGNCPTISYGIKQCKYFLGELSTSSPSALRRWVEDFRKNNNDVWIREREGHKAWVDKVAPYDTRDPSLLEVGEGLVADGHDLNFNIVDPITGKPKRAVMVLFWDWRSSYPLGFEIMMSENVQCIATALRNAILTLGKIPKWVYLDNGKAFGANVFHRDIRLQETEIPGMFARLGITVHFALAYNAQSKPVERFFRVFNDWFERMLPSYVGASIQDKPAYLRPNETRARRLHDDWVPEIHEAVQMILQWREFYVDQPLRGRGGDTARRIFEQGKGAGIDPLSLCFLMMPYEIKSVTRERLRFLGIDWTGHCLYGLKDKVLIRYSLSDLKQIYVFTLKGELLGPVTPVVPNHPMVSECEAPKDWYSAGRITAQRRIREKETEMISNAIRGSGGLISFEASRKQAQKMLEHIQEEDAKKPQPPVISPFGIDYRSEPGAFLSDEQNLIEIKGQKNKIVSPVINEPIQPESSAKELCEKLLVVDARTGLSRPTDGTVFKNEFEYYDWYRSIEERFPGILNDTDWRKIEEYQASPEWEDFYSRRRYAPMVRTASDLRHTSPEPCNQEDRR